MAVTFKKEFVKQYTEFLEPYGFKKIKGSQPYFVRVINNEIIHILSYKEEKTGPNSMKEFYIQMGVATIYRREFDLSIPVNHIGNWMKAVDDVYKKKDSYFPEYDRYIRLKNYKYNNENMEDAIRESFFQAKIALDILDDISDMKKAFCYFNKYYFLDVCFSNILDQGYVDHESLFYALNSKMTINTINEILQLKKSDLKKSIWNKEKAEGLKVEEKDIESSLNELILKINEFISDEDNIIEGERKLNKQRDDNMQKLKKYGIV